MMCSFLICWFRVSLARFEHKQTDWLATLTPLFSRYFIHMFQIFYLHFPDIPSTCSWYAPPHPYRCHLRMLRGLQAWKAACVAACHGPHGKKKTVGSCLRISAWLVVKRCFWKYHEKETTAHNLLSEHIEELLEFFQKFSTFEFFYLWVFFWFKKRVVSVQVTWEETSGDVKEEVGGFCFWLAKRIKCVCWRFGGWTLGKGGNFPGFSFGSVV